MLVLSSALPALSPEVVSLYLCKDPLLENLPVLVFYGPSTTGNSTHNSSRIQAHVYSLAGFQTFPRLTISPTSPVYAAVNHLPVEKQGEEVCRGLAISLLSYFAALPKSLKFSLRQLAANRRSDHLAPAMFDEMHAADLAARMVRIEDAEEATKCITCALSPRGISWIDVDILLPPQTMERFQSPEGSEQKSMLGNDGLPLIHYGLYTSLINNLGLPTFLPTSKLKRAPSRPTAHSKSRTLTKDQKVLLRREMCEFLDTEERYIAKLQGLAHGAASDFRKLYPDAFGNLRTNGKVVDRLFPESLHRILDINTSFYDNIQNILQTTEDGAIRDIEEIVDLGPEQRANTLEGRKRDATGTTAFAKTLLNWFPKFMSPYQDYLRASTEFPKIMNESLQDQTSIFVKQVQAFGEQRLRSMLIEPVQRLPRYSLLIDNMANLLPASHPAMNGLLKARDIITDICALDTETCVDGTRVVKCLTSFASNWPKSLSPNSRLITAVDLMELESPYATEEGQPTMLLLFSDTVVLLRKSHSGAMSARGILAEVDRPVLSASVAETLSSSIDSGLIFHKALRLSDLQITESVNGHRIWIASNNESSSILPELPNLSSKLNGFTGGFSLLNTYERKAARLGEEVIKAKIEGRFPETVREGDKWTLRTISAPSDNLGVLAAVHESGHVNDRDFDKALSYIRVFIDDPRSPKSIIAESKGLDIAICITPLDHGLYRLNCESSSGNYFAEETTEENLCAVLLRILGNLRRIQEQAFADLQIPFHRSILAMIPARRHDEASRLRNFRPISPVKMLSNLLGGGSAGQTGSPNKAFDGAPILKNVPLMRPPVSSSHQNERTFTIEEKHASSKVTLVDSMGPNARDPLALLEDTFAAYLVALRSRSGNVVGRILRSRAGADELVVNELYNSLVEDPSKLQAAAEVSIDVLFAAFEKFIKRAWRERMGPLLATDLLLYMQSKFDSGRPSDFARYFKSSVEEMTPQNRRAFTGTIKLLSDLLDASGNDGDRGALIVTFAEALVLDGNPQEYITLLDRLVDDYDNLFDDVTNNSIDERNTPNAALGSLNRTRSFNTGSLSSNASSLRKRFGFGTLSRENSKSESESKVTAVWRTLSKNSKNTGDSQTQPASLSKASLLRSRSTETDSRMPPPLRPGSRDRPAVLGASPHDEQHSRPGSAHINTSILGTIGEGTITKPGLLTKKKRRSSLSDLRPLHDAKTESTWSPLQLRKPDSIQQYKGSAKLPGRTPSASRTTLSRQHDRSSPHQFDTPELRTTPQQSKANSPQRFGSPAHKEKSPSIPRPVQPMKMSNPASEEIVITAQSPKRRTPSYSAIPTPNRGLSERTWPPNGTNTPPKKLPQKLRMQSPQKLRERLVNEQKALGGAEISLQAEIDKIGQEISAFKLQRPNSSNTTKPTTPTTETRTLHSLSTTLASLSTKLTTFISSQTTLTAALSSDIDSSLLVSERKCKKLDNLYSEANAENEALYERFNDELGKVLKGVKGGKGDEEMKGKMKEAQEEVVRLKRENGRLKRDGVGLRSLLRE